MWGHAQSLNFYVGDLLWGFRFLVLEGKGHAENAIRVLSLDFVLVDVGSELQREHVVLRGNSLAEKIPPKEIGDCEELFFKPHLTGFFHQ